MVLARAKKQPVTAHHKKRHGQHHKQSKQYTKTYWPYLPMLGVVGLGIAINAFLGANQATLFASTTDLYASRIEQLTGNAQSLYIVAALAVLCVIVFVLKHALGWYRMLRHGEQFIIHHPVVDLLLVVFGVAGFVLTRSTVV